MPPDSSEPAQLVRETDDRPVVRESADNPVVRFRDLEQAIAPIKTQMRVLIAIASVIGVSNLFGFRALQQEIPTQIAEAVRAFLGA